METVKYKPNMNWRSLFNRVHVVQNGMDYRHTQLMILVFLSLLVDRLLFTTYILI